MNKRAAWFAVAILPLFVISVLCADVSGKWIAQVPTRDGGTRETTFNFKVEGTELTGTMSGRQGDVPIAEGKVSGDDVSFSVTLEFGGNSVKLLYKGQVSGNEIKFTRTREGSDQAQEFTAKRATT